jgi:hypothetical protein
MKWADRPLMRRMARGKLTGHPSSSRRDVKKQMHVSGYDYHRVQIDGHSTLPKATLEDQLPGLGGKTPTFECPECYENGTIVFEQMR